MPSPPRSNDWLLLTALVAVWGSSFAMTKIAVTGLDASWVMALRLAVAALVLIPYAFAQGETLTATNSVWAKFTWLGFIGSTLPFLIITWGMHYVSSGVAGLLMGSIPLFLVVMAHFSLPDERLTLLKSAGFILGFIGIVILMGPEQFGHLALSGKELQGELAILAGCLCYAVHAVSAKRLGVEQPAKQSAAVCLAAALMGVAFAAVTEPHGLANAKSAAVLSVIGLGLFPTALATLMSYRLMARVGPSFVSYANYLVPVWAVLLGAIAFGEALELRVLAALVFILGGIAVSRIPPQHQPTTRTPI
jgi:drug/metabolite transporter (DMT)-like permease